LFTPRPKASRMWVDEPVAASAVSADQCWTAIETLCAEYGIDPKETVAVGDGLNDLEMVREAGLGIAMANADPRIAAVADSRVGHHDSHGFADAAELVIAANR
jgi:hydroxymethylpyrimidine pyrophosphatase-like HAD family hydrolase